MALIIIALLALSWGLLRLSWSAHQIWLQTPQWRSVRVCAVVDSILGWALLALALHLTLSHAL
ncbi:MAG: hypothetical protein E6R03_18500 [Hyphomicrobiaceae bacterium]|nr:MAG: hypothetical protein E6R03_18500 [Hyphomicrobiaceae bacterium]